MNKKVTLKDVKESLQPKIQLIKTHTLSSEDISLVLHMAVEEILYPQQKSIQDRIIPITLNDDRPCDTEAPDNVVRVDFK